MVWYGTSEGLYLIKESPIKCFDQHFFNDKNFEFNNVLADKNNIIWVCTDEKLYRFYKNKLSEIGKKSFENLFDRWKNNNLNAKYSFLEDPNGSFEKYDMLIRKGKYKYYNPYQYVRYKKYQHYPPYSVSKIWQPTPRIEFSYFQNIGYDQQGKLYVITGNGLFQIDTTGKPDHFIILTSGSDNTSFIFDRENNVHLCGWGRLTISHYSENYEDFWQPNYREEPSPVDAYQMAVRYDEVWYASYVKGLYCCKKDNFYDFNSENSRIPDILNSICIDKKNNIIVGANNGHVLICDYKSNKLSVHFDLSYQDGLLGTSVQWLLTDSKNNLWVGTNKGLNQINLNDLYKTRKISIRNFDNEEGFNDFFWKSATIDSTDQLWIACDKQIISVDTRKLLRSQTGIQELKLVRLDINYEPAKINIQPSNTVHLKYNQNTVTLYFESFNYSNSDKDLYRYKLSGKNEKWSSYAKDRKISFNRLSPGSYNLDVECLNSSVPDRV